MNELIDKGVILLVNSFDGLNGVLAIYDIECEEDSIDTFETLEIPYFPLNNYGDFEISCPNCGKRIEDAMILKAYDENVLSGYNIECYAQDCGTQMAVVKKKN